MKYSEFGYSDELAEILMRDAEMMNFIQCAVETNNPEQVLEAIRTVAQARNKREIVIRELGRDVDDLPEVAIQNLNRLFTKI